VLVSLLLGCAVNMCCSVLLLYLQGEQVAAAGLAPEGSGVVLASSGGMLAHFPLDGVRQAGRAAGCVKVRRTGMLSLSLYWCGIESFVQQCTDPHDEQEPLTVECAYHGMCLQCMQSN